MFRKRETILLIFFAIVFSGKVICQTGDLLILAEPDWRVYINDEFLGFTEVRGLHLKNLTAGNSYLKFKKDELEFSKRIDIKENETQEIELSKQSPSKGALIYDKYKSGGYYLSQGGIAALKGGVLAPYAIYLLAFEAKEYNSKCALFNISKKTYNDLTVEELENLIGPSEVENGFEKSVLRKYRIYVTPPESNESEIYMNAEVDPLTSLKFKFYGVESNDNFLKVAEIKTEYRTYLNGKFQTIADDVVKDVFFKFYAWAPESKSEYEIVLR